jgi:hypothetical protein
MRAPRSTTKAAGTHLCTALRAALAVVAISGGLAVGAERAAAQEIGGPITRPCHHPCASQIFLNEDPRLDKLALHARIVPMTDIDPVAEGITVEVYNSIDLVVAFSLGPGDFRATPGGRKFTYRDPRAIRDAGIGRVTISQRKDGPGGYRVDVVAYGDLSLASEPDMTVRILVGNDMFTNSSTWLARGYGWMVQFPL